MNGLENKMDIINRINKILNESSPFVSMLTMFSTKSHNNQVWYNVDTNEVIYSSNWRIPHGSVIDTNIFEIAKNLGLTLIPIRVPRKNKINVKL